MAWDDIKVENNGITPFGKLNASEYNALVTAVKARVLESLFDANTILKADSDDTPTVLTVDEQRLVGRITAGVITGLTAAQIRTLLNVADGANAYSHPNHTGDVTSTGDGLTVIAAGAIDIAMHSAGGTPSSSTFYRGDNTWSAGAAGTTISAESFSESVAHLTTDADAGKAFTITSFPAHGQITTIRVRADFTAGQQANTGTALVNNGSGILPAGTSIVYDGDSPTDLFAVDDQILIDSEWMDVTAVDTGTNTLTVTRGIKGTIAAFHDDNSVITKGNHGVRVRVVLFKDSSKLWAERIIELSSMMTYSGTTDASITATDDYFGLTSDIQNVGSGDFVVIEDTADEVCKVQNVNHDTVSATYDYTIFVQDGLAAHATTKEVNKLVVYDLDTPYSSGAGTLYGTVYIDEKISSTVNVTIEIDTDSYT